MAMSLKGLPVSATLGNITILAGDSVTDQIASYHAPDSARTVSELAGVTTGVAVAIVLCAAVLGLVWLRRRVRRRRLSTQKVCYSV